MGKPKVKKSAQVIAELERLRKKRRGLLKPVDVVKAAEPETSVLHGCFCWDDTVAAHRYRIQQAQELIRMQVRVIPNTNDRPWPIYVHLAEDKSGYRPMEEVMKKRPLRKSLVSQAMAEYELWYRKWQDLKELAAIFEAADKVKAA
jgi:hypothetical protein